MSSDAASLRNIVQPYPALRDPHWASIAKPHEAIVQREFSEARPQDMMRALKVAKGMAKQPPLDLGVDEINWDEELAVFSKLPYPDYYTLPFHSQLGGWLSPSAALANRRAMETIYKDSHPHACTGLRDELANLMPADAHVVIDMGAGDGDGAAAIARRFPKARVIAVEASPFMIIVGRRQNRTAGIEWKHCLAEATGLESNSADCINITLVFHECSDKGKMAIMKEAFRLLRPGGTLVFSDTPPANLQTYRGFHEPWKDQWLHFNVDHFLSGIGFTDLQTVQLIVPEKEEQLFTRIAKKPAAKL